MSEIDWRQYPVPTAIESKDARIQEVLIAIAALAEGLRARDRQLDALSEQVRLGFEELSRRTEFNNLMLKDGLERGKERYESLTEQVRLLGEQEQVHFGDLSMQIGALESLISRPAHKPKKGKKR